MKTIENLKTRVIGKAESNIAQAEANGRDYDNEYYGCRDAIQTVWNEIIYNEVKASALVVIVMTKLQTENDAVPGIPKAPCDHNVNTLEGIANFIDSWDKIFKKI